MCAGFSRLRVGCIAAYACGPKGAGGATCTRTPRMARSFEVRVYADSTTPAGNGAEGETCTPKAHWLSTRSVCLIPDKPLRQRIGRDGEVRARALTAPSRALFLAKLRPDKLAPEGGSAPPTSRLTVARSAN